MPFFMSHILDVNIWNEAIYDIMVNSLDTSLSESILYTLFQIISFFVFLVYFFAEYLWLPGENAATGISSNKLYFSHKYIWNF